MSTLNAVLLLLAAYLVGSIPFGYLVGRFRGVDLFKAGSGNIGATNAARVLGRPFGVLVFVLDFLKGALPVALIVPLADALSTDGASALGEPEVLRVGAAALAFLGHLFPVYLGFRGGKGIATGAGTVFVLVPGPAILAVLAWLVAVVTTRFVSLGSLAAVSILVIAHLFTPTPFARHTLPVTLYLLAGTGFVVWKHRTNLTRLVAGTESRIGDSPMRDTLVRVLHVMALGMWFGGAGFFNFGAAPSIFASFEQVVNTSPSDRTAYVNIVPEGASAETKKNLSSALAGAAVGPIFDKYFLMQLVCGAVALATAGVWWKFGRLHRTRVIVIAVGLLTVLIGWWVSGEVTATRLARFSPDESVAKAAKAAFNSIHFVSLGLSFVTISLAAAALAMAAKLPPGENPTAAGGGI